MPDHLISFQGVSDTLTAITRFCRAKHISPSFEARIAEELFYRTFQVPPSEEAIAAAWNVVARQAANAWASRKDSEFIRECRRLGVPLIPLVQYDVARPSASPPAAPACPPSP